MIYPAFLLPSYNFLIFQQCVGQPYLDSGTTPGLAEKIIQNWFDMEEKIKRPENAR